MPKTRTCAQLCVVLLIILGYIISIIIINVILQVRCVLVSRIVNWLELDTFSGVNPGGMGDTPHPQYLTRGDGLCDQPNHLPPPPII